MSNRVDCYGKVFYKKIDQKNIAFYVEDIRKDKNGDDKMYEDFIGYYRLSPQGILQGLWKSRQLLLYKEDIDGIDKLIGRFEELIEKEKEVIKMTVKKK